MKKLPSCSLIISTYNWPEALELVLLSVKKQTFFPDEVIVADDGSRTETAELIKKLQANFPVPLLHIWQEDDGFRKSIILNKAVAKAKGEYIITIDGDIIINPQFVKDHLNLCEPNVFLYGKRVKLQKKILPKLFKNKILSFNIFSNGISKRLRTLRIPFLSNFYKSSNVRGGAIRGCNLSFWRSDFIKVNGYNEEMTGWGKEDTELTHRFINNNISSKMIKFKAIAYHIYHPDASRDKLEKNIAIQRKTIKEKVLRCSVGVSQYL